MNLSAKAIDAELLKLPSSDEEYATRFVERLLEAARQVEASDLAAA